MERNYRENIVGIRKMERKSKNVKRVNLTDLLGNFAYTIQETLIKYLVTGPSDRIDIFDLNNIKVECDFEFDLESGRVTALIVPISCGLSWLGKREEYFIPCTRIT